MTDQLIYLYGIVPADAPESASDLTGLEGAEVQLVRYPETGIGGIVSRVPAGDYEENKLNSRLDDLEWIGERGLAHETVLSWYAERGPVIPLSLFSLHQDEDRLRERLAQDAETNLRVLESLRGRTEWGVRLWRMDERFKEQIDEISPALQALTEEMEGVQPGRRFLLEKKRDGLMKDEMRTASAKVAREFFERIDAFAERSTRMSIPPVPSEGKTLVLHSAFLVDDERYAEFQKALNEQANRVAEIGFETEFTGPWPAYHFADEPAD
jgi:Gas vesicle synthesis protein GvpL/GvpF.